MKNKRTRVAYILTTFIFLFTYVGLYFTSIKAYAEDNKNYIVATLSTSSSKPKSGSFSSGSKSYTIKPKTTTIKPDSGSFSTKPNTSTTKPNPSTTIKPDSGSFSTKPSTNNSSNSNTNTSNNNDTSSSGGGYSQPVFKGGYYGGYNPFSRIFYGFNISSWIIKLVILITIIVVIFIVVDYIRSRRD